MIGWAGTVFGILGALFVACNMGVADIGYCFFTVGSIFCLIDSIKKQDNANIILWLVFLIINLFGLWSFAK